MIVIGRKFAKIQLRAQHGIVSGDRKTRLCLKLMQFFSAASKHFDYSNRFMVAKKNKEG